MNTARPKMSRENRAKQFMPFSALKGLEEALSRVEDTKQEKIALCDGEIEKINDSLNKLRRGDRVSLISYADGKYTRVSGTVQRMNEHKKYLETEETRVYFEDILCFYDSQRTASLLQFAPQCDRINK